MKGQLHVSVLAVPRPDDVWTVELGMPFKSLAQMRWGNSPAGRKALGGAGKVAEWNSATKGMKLPAVKKNAAKGLLDGLRGMKRK